MKILYGIQMTGNGHIKRSSILISKLRELGHDVDILTSGDGANLEIKSKWNFTGMTLQYKNGSIDWIKTIVKSKPIKFIKDIFSDLGKYDLVISDFEPISALYARINKIKSISICNQNSITLNGSGSGISMWFIKWFAKCEYMIGYDYLGSCDIFQPICNISKFRKKTGDSILVYLPYIDNYKVRDVLNKSGFKAIIYTNQNIKESTTVKVKKINENFTKDLISSKSIITHSGFSTTSEALILGKKLWAIPVKGQFEQEINSQKLKSMGVFTDDDFCLSNLIIWENSFKSIEYKWEDSTDKVVERILNIYYEKN